MWVAEKAFTGVIGGQERAFAKGEKITEIEATEMALADKPGIATRTKKEKAADGHSS